MVLLTLLALLLMACSRGGGPADPTLREKLDAAVAKRLSLDVDGDRVRAVLVDVNGKRVLEKYRDATPSDYWDTESVTKSIVSILVGIAIREGSIRSVDQTLEELLPEQVASMSARAARTTLRQLLTMTGGFPGNALPTVPVMSAADPVAAILESLPRRPTTQFQYSNRSAHLVSAVLHRATGMSVLDYARAKLFDPLGIRTTPAATPLAAEQNMQEFIDADFAWPVDAAGTHLGWGLLKLRPRDMMRIGELMLHEGVHNGQSIVPHGWVGESTAKHVDVGDVAPGYGYEWWLTSVSSKPAFFALGFGGQLIEVLPAHKAVVVVSTEIDPGGAVTEGLAPEFVVSLVSDAIAPLLGPPSG